MMRIHWDKIDNDREKTPENEYCSFANYFLIHRSINMNIVHCLKEKKLYCFGEPKLTSLKSQRFKFYLVCYLFLEHNENYHTVTWLQKYFGSTGWETKILLISCCLSIFQMLNPSFFSPAKMLS